MGERACERLLYLRGDRSGRIVRQPMVLAGLEGEFRLEKDVFPSDQSALDGCRDGMADGCFVIVLPLIGRIDAAKALLQSELHQPLSLVLFPSGSVQKIRK